MSEGASVINLSEMDKATSPVQLIPETTPT